MKTKDLSGIASEAARRRKKGTALFLAGCLPVAGCAFDASGPSSTDPRYLNVHVSGTVRTSVGDPVPNVVVFLFVEGWNLVQADSVLTDAGGHYSIGPKEVLDIHCDDLFVEFLTPSHNVSRFLGRCGTHTVTIDSWPEGG